MDKSAKTKLEAKMIVKSAARLAVLLCGIAECYNCTRPLPRNCMHVLIIQASD